MNIILIYSSVKEHSLYWQFLFSTTLMTIKNPTSHPRQICYSQLMVMLYAKCYVHRTVPFRHYVLGNATCE